MLIHLIYEMLIHSMSTLCLNSSSSWSLCYTASV
jgi:hypothetical protein